MARRLTPGLGRHPTNQGYLALYPALVEELDRVAFDDRAGKGSVAVLVDVSSFNIETAVRSPAAVSPEFPPWRRAAQPLSAA
jgi:hypothetical protein